MKKTLYIDMDGVVADFDAGIKAFDPSLHTGDNFGDYQSRFDRVNIICQANPTIFHALPPIKDSIESVKELFHLFDCYFLSVPMWHVPESFTGKRIWIENHFGDFANERLILTHRKDLNSGDYIIDDRTRHGVDKFKGIHIHFGSALYPDWKTTLPYMKSLAH